MKNKFYKITLFISIITLLLAFLVIPSFAAESIFLSPDTPFTFSNSITFTESFSYFIPFTSNDINFDYITVDADEGSIIYTSDMGEELTVFSNSAWSSAVYRTITALDVTFIDDDAAINFFTENEAGDDSNFSMFTTIYQLFESAIFGVDGPDNFGILSLTLISLVVCFALCLLPLIVIFWLIKFILSIGRSW